MWVNLDNSSDTMFSVPRQIPEAVADCISTVDERSKTEDVVIRDNAIPVECGIAPIVRYLNSFSSIQTVGSCAGHDWLRVEKIVFKSRPPWVAFVCSDFGLVESLVHTFNPEHLYDNSYMTYQGKRPNIQNVTASDEHTWLLLFQDIDSLTRCLKKLEHHENA